jgi:hypothetical protein
MSLPSHFANRMTAVLIASFLSVPAFGKEFAVRPVTHFGGQPIAPSAVPLTVVGDYLLLSATENGQPRIYRTDGNSIQLIDQTTSIPQNDLVPGGIELVNLGGEVFFPGRGSSGGGLYATNGTTLRRVGGPFPRELELVNDNLVFEGGVSQLFRSDGTVVEDFPLAKSPFVGTARVNNRLMFGGYPVGGGVVLAYSTDGQTLSPITSSGQTLGGPQHLTTIGNDVYFVAQGLADPAIYRTSDGLVAERFAYFEDFTFTNAASDMLAFQGSLYVQVYSPLSGEMVFYKSSGGLPTEVLRWELPAGVFPSQVFDNPPLLVAEDRAYYQISIGSNASLYAFDGHSFDEISLNESYIEFEFQHFEGRTFLNARGIFESLTLFELTDGNLVQLGTGLDSMTLFKGELFGINNRLPNPFQPTTLHRTENGELVALGNFGNSPSLAHQTRFVEFGGQLYFSGSAAGRQPQLFAVVEVPEPTTLASVAFASLAAGYIRPRRRSLRSHVQRKGAHSHCANDG